jgi:DNA-binding transcriptional regulator LsrR (DeoR family)
VDPSRENRLAEIARSYYFDNRTQAEIAGSFGISRSQVSRYLSEAREMGIVQIRINSPQAAASTLAAQLRDRYPHLAHVTIAPYFGNTPEAMRTMIGRYAASLISELVKPEQIIALGCGRTLLATVQALPKSTVDGISVVQAMGNLGHEAHEIDYNEITREAATALGTRPTYVSAPAILGRGSGEAMVFLKNNPIVDQALKLAKSADLILVGLGSMESDLVYTRFGLIQPQELQDLSGRAVGDICGRFFNINGIPQRSIFNDRIIGIDLEDLQKAAITIGAAGGWDKVAPLLGAVRGRFINALVTDEQTLTSILALDDTFPQSA